MIYTYARDKRNEGQYNVRAVGPEAGAQVGQTVHVTTSGGAERPETLGRKIWEGTDNDSGQPVALYAKGGNNAPRGGGDGKRFADLEERVRILEHRLATMANNAAGASSVEDGDLPF